MSLDLALSEEQEMFRAAIHDVCGRFSDSVTVRELEDDPVGYRSDLWQALSDLGMHGPISDDAAGNGLSAVELAVAYEEFGRALCPSPHLVSSVLAASLISRVGTPAQQECWLSPLSTGAAVMTCAWIEPQSSMDARGIRMSAKADGSRVRLSGMKTLVPFAGAADAYLVLARSDAGVTIYVVERNTLGVSLVQVPTLSSDTSFRITFDAVTVPESARLGADGTGWELWEDVMTDALIVLAAYAVGGASRALEMATDYAKSRVQFGQPIGAFQGVSHPLAEIAMEVEGARVLAYEAAWSRANRKDTRALAAMAKLYACDVFRRTTKVAHQVFGGIGFTRDIDIQLYYRRAKQLELTWWGPTELEERIAAIELDSADPFVTVAGGFSE